MNKLKQQQELLQDLEFLIRLMQKEIENLRAIGYRYFLKHGKLNIKNSIDMPDNICQHISIQKENATIEFVDHKKINILSNYELIKKELKKLNE